jgi:hypothetical protein
VLRPQLLQTCTTNESNLTTISMTTSFKAEPPANDTSKQVLKS